MFPHDTRPTRGPFPGSPGDQPIGPDADAWPGEQTRRIDDGYRSWRHDRYREHSDASLPPGGTGARDEAPALRPRSGRRA